MAPLRQQQRIALRPSCRRHRLGRFQGEGKPEWIIADPTGEIASQWGVVGVPTTFVIAAAGRNRDATVGLSTEPGLRLRLWLADSGDH